MKQARPCRHGRSVESHFRNRLTRREERMMRAHVAQCPECRDRYEVLRHVAAIDPAASSAKQRLSQALTLRSRPDWPRTATIAAGFVVAVTFVTLLTAGPEDEYAARGADSLAVSQVHMYRIAKGERTTLLDAEMGPDDELAFAYENALGYEHLLIFAVDEQRLVYWYHPAWLTKHESPGAVPILSSPNLVELEEAVAHGLKEGPLWIYTVFTNDALGVCAIERMLAGLPEIGSELSVTGTQDVRLIHVHGEGGVR